MSDLKNVKEYLENLCIKINQEEKLNEIDEKIINYLTFLLDLKNKFLEL